MVSGYQNLGRFDVDGTDFFETHLAFKQAVGRARKGKGPSVIISHVVRLEPHSSSDDHLKYRGKNEIDEMKKNDPILKFRTECITNNVIKKEEFEKIDIKLKDQVDQEAERVEAQDHPEVTTATNHLYSNETPKGEHMINTINDKLSLIHI